MIEKTLKTIESWKGKPSKLRIIDIRFAMIGGAPMDCILIKIITNSELVGFGEIRDGSSMVYAKMLKSRIVGLNPCNVTDIFENIKQFGGHSRQGGGVSGIEIALWDLVGKAYGIPIYQLLGGSFRDKVRMYSDTDCEGKPNGKKMGKALLLRKNLGFTFLKMDLGIDQLLEEEGTLCAPIGFLEELKKSSKQLEGPSEGFSTNYRAKKRIQEIAHPFTFVHITEKGFDSLEQYISDARDEVGYDIPLALDHFGHIDITDCIKLASRLEKYNIAWLEDILPWQYTKQYMRLAQQSSIPLCTGEDIYLEKNFHPLIDSGAIGVIHPDVLTAGGILETKKLGDYAYENATAMAIHMAESPVACMAAAHVAKSSKNFIALEFHSVDIPWWKDLVVMEDNSTKIIENGFINVSDSPGLGIKSLNDEVIRQHVHCSESDIWESTDEWNNEWSYDRLWS